MLEEQINKLHWAESQRLQTQLEDPDDTLRFIELSANEMSSGNSDFLTFALHFAQGPFRSTQVAAGCEFVTGRKGQPKAAPSRGTHGL